MPSPPDAPRMSRPPLKLRLRLQLSPAVLKGLAVVGGAAQAVVVTAMLWFVHDTLTGLPPREDLGRIGKMAQATVIFDAHDAQAFSISEEQRRDVPLSAISPNLVKAIIAIEDQRFYDHSGVDLVRIVGAGLSNLREGRRAQGASTLTQQLARQSFLTADKTYTRKVREIVLATRIEREFTKDEILELYLNKVYFGSGLYGAEAAALGYFGKSAKNLSVAEAALLAGLVKSPSTLAPSLHPERAIARRNIVLQMMKEMKVIDEAEFGRARAAGLKVTDALRKDEGFGQYFKEMVRAELVERFGREQVYEGGLRVYTTIDLAMQRAAETAVAASIARLEARRAAVQKGRKTPAPDTGGPLQAALVSIDPSNGHIRALVGGRRFEDSNYNRAILAKRQPGSAFKPFVYAAALEAGYTPASLIDRLDEPIDTLQGQWSPEDGHSTAPELTMRTALRTSSNRAAVRMLEDIGVAKAVDYAQKMGIGSMPSVPSLALGSGEVTLLDMTAAYGTFASAGVLHHPVFLRRVEDAAGTVLFASEDVATQAITPQTAYLMSTMLADVINSGTAWKARELGFKLPAAGKTGTTNDYHDAWFVGFTPSVVSGVWVGYDTPQPILPGSAYAGDVAVPLWADFMKAATAGAKPAWIARPKDIVTVEVCRLSGKLPAGGCGTVQVALTDGSTTERSMLFTESFVRGTQPHDTCHLHVGKSLFGHLAGIFKTPSPAVEAVRLADVAPEAAAPAAVVEEAKAADEVKEEAPKKRGFWGRVFGRGGDKDNERDDKNRKKNEKKNQEMN